MPQFDIDKYKNSVLAQGTISDAREKEILSQPARWRLVRKVRGQGTLKADVGGLHEVVAALSHLSPRERQKTLVYAFRDYEDGERAALFPRQFTEAILYHVMGDRYDGFDRNGLVCGLRIPDLMSRDTCDKGIHGS